MSLKTFNVDCNDEELNWAVDAAKRALNQSTSNQKRASYVRKAMDDKYGPAWSCITGKDFGRFVYKFRP